MAGMCLLVGTTDPRTEVMLMTRVREGKVRDILAKLDHRETPIEGLAGVLA